MDKDLSSIQEARQLLGKAEAAFKIFEDYSEDDVELILEAISKIAIENAGVLADLAVEETGFGRAEDKKTKNLFCAENVYEAIKPLKTVGIVNEDSENQIIEVASPVGVVAGIIPSTNPTSTTIYKALIALKGRNGIVFSPHPSAVRCIGETARLIAQAAEDAGAPQGIIGCMSIPTMEGTQELMKNKTTAVILATGGPGLVKAAYSAGKPAFGVGPGNVPAYIESSAGVSKAVEDILTGKCFDNGTLCSSEQSIICDKGISGEVLSELTRQGAYICNNEEKIRLGKVIQTPSGRLNTEIVGQSAFRIAAMAGIEVSEGTRALVAPAEGIGREHPLSMEKLSPILAYYTVNDWKEGCQKCIDILNFGGLGHTLALHSKNNEVIRQFALYKPAFRICVNTPAALGAVGYTTNLFPSMTLGCGAAGGNITSDNISPLHLINIKRVAFGVREVALSSYKGTPETVSKPLNVETSVEVQRGKIADLVGGWLERKPQSRPSPPLATYGDLRKTMEQEVSHQDNPAAFVCEEDVRAASKANNKIVLDQKTIITPLARELGEDLDVFIQTS